MEEKIHTWSAERETRPAKKQGSAACVFICVCCPLHTYALRVQTHPLGPQGPFFLLLLLFFFMTLISWVGSLTWAFACLRHDHPSHASGRPLWRQLRGGYERPVDSTTTSFLLFFLSREFVFIPLPLFLCIYTCVCTVSKGTNDVLTRRDLSISLKKALLFFLFFLFENKCTAFGNLLIFLWDQIFCFFFFFF